MNSTDIDWTLELLKLLIPVLTTLVVGSFLFIRQENIRKQISHFLMVETHLYQRRAEAIEQIIHLIVDLEIELEYLVDEDRESNLPNSSPDRRFIDVLRDASTNLEKLEKLIRSKQIYLDEDSMFITGMTLSSLRQSWTAIGKILRSGASTADIVNSVREAEQTLRSTLPAFENELVTRFRSILEGGVAPNLTMTVPLDDDRPTPPPTQ